MKGIHLADLHNGLVYKGIDFTQRIYNCVDQVYKEAKNIIEELLYIVIHGDVVHLAESNADVIIHCVKQFRLFDSLGVPVFILQGNHDLKTRRTGEFTLFDVFKEIRFNNVHFFSDPTFFAFPEDVETRYNLIMLPYDVYDDEEALKKIYPVAEKAGKELIVCTHHDLPASIAEYQAGSELDMRYGKEKRIPESLFKRKDVVKILNGHIHKPQTIGNIELIGSVESFRFGEGSERFFLKVDLS